MNKKWFKPDWDFYLPMCVVLILLFIKLLNILFEWLLGDYVILLIPVGFFLGIQLTAIFYKWLYPNDYVRSKKKRSHNPQKKQKRLRRKRKKRK